MNRVLAGTAAAILLPAGIIAVMAALPAAAEEPPGPPPPPAVDAAASPEMLAAMQRDLGLDAKGARDRIAKDNAASRTGQSLRKKLGSKYGGAWLTDDAKSLVVAVTDAAQADEVTAAGATPKLVTRSSKKLNALKAVLDSAAAKAPASAVPGWYVDEQTNTVVVQAHGDDDAAKAFIKASGVDATAVRVVETTEQPRLFEDVRGGDGFAIGSGRCSVGFAVEGGFVTAGHCGKAGQATTGGDSFKVEQGTFKGSSYPDNDYAFVTVNEKWTPQPWVNDGDGGNVNVNGSEPAIPGVAVCRSGLSSGWRCGLLEAINQTVNYDKENTVVTGMARTTACADPGDSGGPWLSGQQAQGVTSGGSGTCSEGGSTYTYFQPINEILSAYDLKLVTTGGVNCKGLKASARGSLDQSGNAYEPNNTFYQSTVAGVHRACLTGPAKTDFDLYLQMWKGSWVTVAKSEGATADEAIFYTGLPGYYIWRVYAYKGSGPWSLGYSAP